MSIVRSLKRSTTRLYANPKALDIPEKRERIEQIVLLLQSILEARGRVMLELNVPAERPKQSSIRFPRCANRPSASCMVPPDMP